MRILSSALLVLVLSNPGLEPLAGAADINTPSNTSPGGANIGFQRDDAGTAVPATQSGIQAGISGRTRAPDISAVPGLGCPCPPGAAPGDLGEMPGASVVPDELEPNTGEFACICPGDTAFQGPVIPPAQLPGQAPLDSEPSTVIEEGEMK